MNERIRLYLHIIKYGTLLFVQVLSFVFEIVNYFISLSTLISHFALLFYLYFHCMQGFSMRSRSCFIIWNKIDLGYWVGKTRVHNQYRGLLTDVSIVLNLTGRKL